MKQFKIFKHPAGEIQAVKQGWCWPAFFFEWIWALFSKMWALGFGVLIGSFILGVVAAMAGASEEAINGLSGLLSLILCFVFGVNGNEWREKNLLSRGFDFKDTVTAANKEGAIALFLKA
jgi:hypothetical protein